MKTIQMPVSEYQDLQKELELLKNSELLENVNKLIDLLYQDKYGLYMGDFTEDLTEYAVSENWEDAPDGWDNV